MHLAVEQRRQAKDKRARDLPLDLRRIDDSAGIGGGDDAMHLDLVAIGHRDFGGAGDVTSEPHLLGDAAKHALRRGLAPADALRGRIEDGEMFGMVRHQLAAECERVLPGRMRQLIHEAFEIDSVLVAVDAAPDARRNMGITHRMVDQQMGDGVTQPRVLGASPGGEALEVNGSMPFSSA